MFYKNKRARTANHPCARLSWSSFHRCCCLMVKQAMTIMRVEPAFTVAASPSALQLRSPQS